MKNLTQRFAYAGTTAYLSILPVSKAFAQLGGSIPAVPGSAASTQTVRQSVLNVLNAVLGFLALLALIFVVIGGIRIIAAGGNEENVTKGRKTIIYALIGLVVIFFARVLVTLAATGFENLT